MWLFSAEHLQYLWNIARQRYSSLLTGNCISASGLSQNERPWLTLNDRYTLYCTQRASFRAYEDNLNEDRFIDTSAHCQTVA